MQTGGVCGGGGRKGEGRGNQLRHVAIYLQLLNTREATTILSEPQALEIMRVFDKSV